ncbi:MAG: hypothetical protein GXO22_00325 [Aquificae bacterium]|nr:hypothetical protein [Aquificota bacterium]
MSHNKFYVRYIICVLIFLFLYKSDTFANSRFYSKKELAVGFYSGEVQGIRSVIFRPNYFFSAVLKDNVSDSFRFEFFLRTLYGDARTGDSDIENQFLQTDIFFKLFYKLQDKRNFKILTGFFSEIYIPLKDFVPFITEVQKEYGAGEDKIPTDKPFNFGINIRFDGIYDKFFSSLEIAYYIYGHRVAPNLAPMAPLFGIFWENRVFFFGDFYKPVFSFFINSGFIMQKKYDGSKILTKHDFFAGTKREFDIEMGIDYIFRTHYHFFFVFYGYNNLNRGWSRTEPHAFRDGFFTGVGYIF